MLAYYAFPAVSFFETFSFLNTEPFQHHAHSGIKPEKSAIYGSWVTLLASKAEIENLDQQIAQKEKEISDVRSVLVFVYREWFSYVGKFVLNMFF